MRAFSSIQFTPSSFSVSFLLHLSQSLCVSLLDLNISFIFIHPLHLFIFQSPIHSTSLRISSSSSPPHVFSPLLLISPADLSHVSSCVAYQAWISSLVPCLPSEGSSCPIPFLPSSLHSSFSPFSLHPIIVLHKEPVSLSHLLKI